jgi:hypothetical protein
VYEAGTDAFADPSRYSRWVRHVLVVIAVLVAGCGRPAGPKHASLPSSGPTKTVGSTGPAPTGNGAGGSVAVVLPAVGCPSPTCVFHAGASGYFTCLSSGAGACFHFSSSCAPLDSCMYDPLDRLYKHCAKASEGLCLQWGVACTPATRCMFKPSDGLHHQCEEVAGGGCQRYGALCAP